MAKFYAGLDMGSSSFELAVVNQEGHVVFRIQGQTSGANLIDRIQSARKRCSCVRWTHTKLVERR